MNIFQMAMDLLNTFDGKMIDPNTGATSPATAESIAAADQLIKTAIDRAETAGLVEFPQDDDPAISIFGLVVSLQKTPFMDFVEAFLPHMRTYISAITVEDMTDER